MLDADDEKRGTLSWIPRLLYKTRSLDTRHKAWWEPKTGCRGLVELVQHSDIEK